MKKQLILGLGLLAAFSASAQVSLVKEVERNLKTKNEYPKQMPALQPAFTNPETAESAYPYFVAGKYGVDFYEQQSMLSRAGQQINAKEMAHALMDGYGYLVKSLALDTVVDAKGKVKTKYSKDIIKLVDKAYPLFDDAGVVLFTEKDYKGAYDIWQLIFDAPKDPVLGVNAPKIYPDSVLNIIAFNQGLAAYNLADWEATLKSLDKAIEYGYNEEKVYELAIAAASNFPDGERQQLMAKYSELAYPLYGQTNDMYLGNIINNMMHQGKYAEAEAAVKKYIESAPDNAQLYFILGVLYENDESNLPQGYDLAIEQFKKCVELDPAHDRALQQLGMLILTQAGTIDDQASREEYREIRKNVVDPMLREAAAYLEKAYELNPEDTASLSNLRNIYYNLNDSDNLKRIEELQKYN